MFSKRAHGGAVPRSVKVFRGDGRPVDHVDPVPADLPVAGVEFAVSSGYWSEATPQVAGDAGACNGCGRSIRPGDPMVKFRSSAGGGGQMCAACVRAMPIARTHRS